MGFYTYEWPAWHYRLERWLPVPHAHHDQTEEAHKQAQQWGLTPGSDVFDYFPRWHARANWGDWQACSYHNRLWWAYLVAWWRVIWLRLFANYVHHRPLIPYWYLFVTGEWGPIGKALRRKVREVVTQ